MTFGDHSDAHQAGARPGYDRSRGRACSAAGLVVVQAGHVRPASQWAHRRSGGPDLGPGVRGLRATQAVEVVAAGSGALLHDVGLLHPAHGLHRGLRRAVQAGFPLPIVGHWDALGFLQDFFALAVLAGIITFAIIRLRSEPKEYGRQSRFYGSHTGGAWLILFMIFNVIWSYAVFRGAAMNAGDFPYGRGAFVSHAWASCWPAGPARQRGASRPSRCCCRSPSCWRSC